MYIHIQYIHYTRSVLAPKKQNFSQSRNYGRYTLGLIGKTIGLRRYDGAEKSIIGSTLPVFSQEVSGANQVALLLAILY